MGYLHIPNLYRPEAQQILHFKTLFACEKVHGTSAHIRWMRDDAQGHLSFFSGGENHDRFVSLFDTARLEALFTEKFGLVDYPIFIYGEAYGGKQQGMSGTYGPDLRFIAFDVKVGDSWLSVPGACRLVESLELEFVPWHEIPSTLEAIDAERDRPSEVAVRRGITEEKIREGIVLRPPFEATLNRGNRLIAKHKRAEFSERSSGYPGLLDPVKKAALEGAEAIVEEWVTAMRLEHVIDKLKGSYGRDLMIQDMPELIRAMVEDVTREATGEIVDSKEARKAISHKTVKMFKARLQAGIPKG